MTFSVTQAPQLAAAAGRGDLRALGALLRDIVDHIDGLSPTELGYIDGVTAGAALASKALVLDASKNITSINQMSMTTAFITTLTNVATAAVTTLTSLVGTFGTAGITALTALNLTATTQNVTHARPGANATQGTFAAFGVSPVSQLAAITGGGVTAVTVTNAAGFATEAQGNALVAAVADMRRKFAQLGFAITSAPA